MVNMNSHISVFAIGQHKPRFKKKIDRILKTDFKTLYFENFGNIII